VGGEFQTALISGWFCRIAFVDYTNMNGMAIRHPNGSWTPFGDVEGQAGDRGNFRTVSVDGLFKP